MRIVSRFLAAMGFALASAHLSAAVVYSGPQNVVYSEYDFVNTFSLFGHAATWDDIRLDLHVFEDPMFQNSYDFQTMMEVHGNKVRFAGSSGDVKTFAAAALIDNTSSFPQNTYLDFSSSMTMFDPPPGFTFENGNFRNATGYAGFAMVDGANVYYGWMQVSVTNYNNGNMQATLIDWAYESQPGVGIQAGAVGDDDDDDDGVVDTLDAFPLDPNESVDTDSDGTGNNADTDDDGDGVGDSFVSAPSIVSAGYSHACALDSTGVHCWGDNTNSKTTVPALVNPVAVSAGGLHTCALDSTDVHCWGGNADGQTTVPALVNPVAVDTGTFHTCALDNTGVHCWGRNNQGQTDVPALVAPVAVNAGALHSCALDSAGVHCWGYNTAGQTTVPALVNPVAVSLGDFHTCALDSTGVHCWGDNTQGQSTVPALVNPVAVSAGAFHTCALDSTGVHCWGNNVSGESTVPALVAPVAVSAGRNFTCALDNTGVHCWGINDFGQSDVPGVLVSTDNCPLVANANQLDTDGDGDGDACDTDDDNDSVLDGDDAFPLDETEFEDTDGDNLGDNTDPIIDDASTLNDVLGDIKTDKAGASVAFAGDVNGDGYGDYLIGIPGYDIPAAPPIKLIKDAGRAVVISGKTGLELMSINGTAAKDAMGFAVAGGGDVNNDGFDDVLVGAPYSDNLTDPSNKRADAGSVTVLYGPAAASTGTYRGAQAKSLYGSALALGDTNNDGWDDMIIGAPKADDLRDAANKLVDAGSVNVYTDNGSPDLNVFYGAVAKAYFGTAVAAGDFNNDNSRDIIVGAPNDDDVDHKLTDAGSVTVYNIAGTGLLKQYGIVAKAYLGKSVASGDVNNDNYADVLAGAPGDDSAPLKDVGSVTVFYGADAEDPYAFYGATAKVGLGNSVAVGDVNNDGFADIITGAKLDDKPTLPIITKDTGSVSIWSGSNYVQIGSTLYGDVTKDYFGTSVSAGDVNNDGKSDLIIGIPGFDLPATPTTKIIKDAGAVKVQSGATLSL